MNFKTFKAYISAYDNPLNVMFRTALNKFPFTAKLRNGLEVEIKSKRHAYFFTTLRELDVIYVDDRFIQFRYMDRMLKFYFDINGFVALGEIFRKGIYDVDVSFKHYPMIHLQIPLWLYLKYFSSPKPNGYGLIAGFDLNSDRLNVVVINKDGKVVAKKTWWYSEVVSHGFPKEKARALRLNALSESLNSLSRIGVDYVVFEDLFLVKKRKFTRSRSGNRKITRFAKKQLLIHGVIKALRLGFNVILVNPKGTTNSEEHEKVMREKGFDRHIASAYLIVLKCLGMLNDAK